MSYSWHKQWQSFFPRQYREITIEAHRADIKIGDTTIEFQSSPITSAEMSEREQFYGKMLWVLDARRVKDFYWCAVESIDRNRFYAEFWLDSDSPASWYRPSTPVILHIGGNDLIWIVEHYATTFGNGVYVQRPILVERFLAGNFECPAENLYRLPGNKLANKLNLAGIG